METSQDDDLTWQLTFDFLFIFHLTFYSWYLTFFIWHFSFDFLLLTFFIFHLTFEIWYLTLIWYGMTLWNYIHKIPINFRWWILSNLGRRHKWFKRTLLAHLKIKWPWLSFFPDVKNNAWVCITESSSDDDNENYQQTNHGVVSKIYPF